MNLKQSISFLRRRDWSGEWRGFRVSRPIRINGETFFEVNRPSAPHGQEGNLISGKKLKTLANLASEVLA